MLLWLWLYGTIERLIQDTIPPTPNQSSPAASRAKALLSESKGFLWRTGTSTTLRYVFVSNFERVFQINRAGLTWWLESPTSIQRPMS